MNPVTLEPGDPSGSYILDNDIDCSETANWSWEDAIPFFYKSDHNLGFIGITDYNDFQSGFKGDFDGRGYEISGIHQDTTYFPYGNIFIKVSGSTIKDVSFDGYTYL